MTKSPAQKRWKKVRQDYQEVKDLSIDMKLMIAGVFFANIKDIPPEQWTEEDRENLCMAKLILDSANSLYCDLDIKAWKQGIRDKDKQNELTGNQ